MKAISIKQPWIWAFGHGKNVENRQWRYLPNHRGDIIIHASQSFDREGYVWIDKHRRELGFRYPLPHPTAFLKGGVMLKGVLVDALRIDGTANRNPWACGPVALFIEDIRRVKFIPCPGQLGIFDLPEDIAREL